MSEHIHWKETDLSRWEPEQAWDLVVTNYAHAEIGQLPLYRRISSWVVLGGTLLIVGHLHDHQHGDHHGHPQSASATVEAITNMFDSPEWQIDAAYENTRTVHPGGTPVQLRDVIVRTQRIV
ncbi:type 11 methyltransferase [Rhodococcus triatomae BKS 15-14]|nr:type 11 methyltransferase [Rhodococcus triatomae BKS 15-14]